MEYLMDLNENKTLDVFKYGMEISVVARHLNRPDSNFLLH